jgi:anti-anti-sigma factor
MDIEVTRDADIAIAAISGEIDLGDGTRFADEVLGKMPDDCTGLIVDLSGLRYIDSAGVRSLFQIAASLDRRDQPLAVCVPPESLLRSVLKITRVEEVATICATRDEALNAVSNPAS